MIFHSAVKIRRLDWDSNVAFLLRFLAWIKSTGISSSLMFNINILMSRYTCSVGPEYNNQFAQDFDKDLIFPYQILLTSIMIILWSETSPAALPAKITLYGA